MLAVCRKSKRHKDIVKLWLEMEEGIPDILKTVCFDTNKVSIIICIYIVYQTESLKSVRIIIIVF